MTKDEFIIELAEEKGLGEYKALKPEMVVEAAKPVDSPIHNNFEWDDTKCGVEYRLWQARQLITSVVVEGEQMFHNVTCTVDQGYVTKDMMMANPVILEDVLQSAYKELRHFQYKFGHLKEMQQGTIVEILNKGPK